MPLEKIFSLCGTLALTGWLLLVFAPRWKWTARVIAAWLLPLALAVVYLSLVATHFGNSEGGFGSLAEVGLLFRNPHNLLAGWIHYLAFDLFIGSWEVRDAQRVGIHHLLVVPCLVLTFLLGPVGLLLYFALRFGIRRNFFVGDKDERA
ncbi:MAG: ABA4-like family protein [Pyrinomonadaceae bacterium]